MADVETAYFRGEGGGVHAMDLPLPKVVQEQVDKGAVRRVNPDGTPWAPSEGEAAPDPPAKPKPGDPKTAWVGYAVLVGGMNVDDAEAATKHDLIERFGG